VSDQTHIWSVPSIEQSNKRSHVVCLGWVRLKESVQAHGIYNQNLLAVPPTGSISYITTRPARFTGRRPRSRSAAATQHVDQGSKAPRSRAVSCMF
jgi:ribonucleotide reductase alpha subunit